MNTTKGHRKKRKIFGDRISFAGFRSRGAEDKEGDEAVDAEERLERKSLILRLPLKTATTINMAKTNMKD